MPAGELQVASCGGRTNDIFEVKYSCLSSAKFSHRAQTKQTHIALVLWIFGEICKRRPQVKR